jgi:mutator protein MutT
MSKVQKFRVAIYGILIENSKVLITNTRVPSGVATNFPGGGLELGESPVAALTREFAEETCLAVSVGQLLYCSQHFHQNPDYPNEQLIHIYYRVQRLSGEIQHTGNNDDVLSTEWLTLEQLTTRRIFDADLECINHESFRRLLVA